jgi:hypothetical protein
MKLTDKGLLPISILNYGLPKSLIKSQIGYAMTDGLSGNGLFNNVYSGTLFDFKTKKEIDLKVPDYYSYSKDDINTLNFRIKYNTMSFYKKANILHFIYYHNDSAIILTEYQINNNVAKLIYTKTLSSNPTENLKFYPISCDKTGFYTYNIDNREIVYSDY